MNKHVSSTVFLNKEGRTSLAANEVCKANFFSSNEKMARSVLAGSVDSKEHVRLKQLQAYDKPMMDWLSQSDGNVQKFFENPVAAFKEATQASDDFIDGLKGLNDYLPNLNLSMPELPSKLAVASNEAVPSCIFNDYTQGWDMVSALCQKEANEGLQYAYKKGLLAIKFEHTITIHVFALTIDIHVKGEFAAPQIIGGTGTLIQIAIRLAKGEVSVGGMKTDITGALFTFKTNLTSIESPVKREADGKHFDFYINFTNDTFISDIKITNLPPVLMDDSVAQIEKVILGAIQKAYSGKEHKLFDVDLNKIDEKFPYLIPQFIRYSFIENIESPDNNVIGVLVQTNGPRGTKLQLDINSIPAGSRGAVILSNRLVVEELLKSLMMNEMKMSADNIKIENVPRVLSNIRDFNYKDKVANYQPVVKKISLWLCDNLLHLNIDLYVSPSSGINIDYRIVSTYRVKIEQKSAKEQTISFESVDYKESKDVSAAWWVWLLGVLALGIGVLFVAITLAIVDSLSPNIGVGVFTKALGKINWGHADFVKINNVNLDGHMQIGCDVKLVELS